MKESSSGSLQTRLSPTTSLFIPNQQARLMILFMTSPLCLITMKTITPFVFMITMAISLLELGASQPQTQNLLPFFSLWIRFPKCSLTHSFHSNKSAMSIATPSTSIRSLTSQTSVASKPVNHSPFLPL